MPLKRRLRATLATGAIIALARCYLGGPTSDSPDSSSLDASSDAGVEAALCPPGPEAGTLPCDVAAVLAAKCQPCHTIPEQNNAKFPLLTYQDLHAPLGTTGLLHWERAAQVIEPNNFPHMPPAGHPQLVDSDFATLRAWFATCALPGPDDASCPTLDAGPDAATDGD